MVRIDRWTPAVQTCLYRNSSDRMVILRRRQRVLSARGAKLHAWRKLPPGGRAQSVGVHADAVADFYSGKTIEITISSGEGGVNDSYARAISQFIGKHVPGNPNVIAKNMPGAGGLNAIVNVAQVAPPDGLAMGIASPGFTVDLLLDPGNAKIDPRRVKWIGRPTSSRNAFTSFCAA